MSIPIVSIIIPLYNRQNSISRSIYSVLNQTYHHWECIVVDNGSTDQSVNVVKHFVSIDKRVKLISIGKSNANIARNQGIDSCKGRFVAMLDSDDEFKPYHLERRISQIEILKCDGIYGGMTVNNGVKSIDISSNNIKKFSSPADYIFSGEIAPTPSHFYRTMAIKHIRWDPQLKGHQDYDLFVRFSDKFAFLADPDPSVIVNWRLGDKRTFHFPSFKMVYEKYAGRVSDSGKRKYFTNMIIFSIKASNKEAYFYYCTLLSQLGKESIKIKILSKSFIFAVLLNKLSSVYKKIFRIGFNK